jgi:CRP-like cAMP-binding protein
MDYIASFMRHEQVSGKYNDDLVHLPRWTEQEWLRLFARGQFHSVRASEIVIQRDAIDRALHFIAAGTLEVGVTYVDGMSFSPLAKISAGSVIGEQSFFDGLPRSASVWAVVDCELLTLPYAEYEAFAQDDALLAKELLFALGRVLSMRLRNTTVRIRR